MELDDRAKEIVQEIGSAINSAVGNSREVAEAIARLRDAGYAMELILRLEIGLRPNESEDDEETEAALELTDEDMRTLRSMKIRIDSEE